jgi:cation transport regulator ChaB
MIHQKKKILKEFYKKALNVKYEYHLSHGRRQDDMRVLPKL